MLHRLLPPLLLPLFKATGHNLDFIANNPSAQLFVALARAWYVNGGKLEAQRWGPGRVGYKYVRAPLHLRVQQQGMRRTR